MAWLVLRALVIFIVPAELGTFMPWSLAGLLGPVTRFKLHAG